MGRTGGGHLWAAVIGRLGRRQSDGSGTRHFVGRCVGAAVFTGLIRLDPAFCGFALEPGRRIPRR